VVTRAGRLVTGFALAVVVFTPAVGRADDEDIIEYRQHIMKTLGEQAAVIRMIVEHKAPATNFATHTRVLAITAATAKKAFVPKVPGGKAKPEVWAQWGDFAKRLDTLAAAADELAITAKNGDASAAAPKLEAALACKSCHEVYGSEKIKEY
jgi:cytochrome c556